MFAAPLRASSPPHASSVLEPSAQVPLLVASRATKTKSRKRGSRHYVIGSCVETSGCYVYFHTWLGEFHQNILDLSCPYSHRHIFRCRDILCVVDKANFVKFPKKHKQTRYFVQQHTFPRFPSSNRSPKSPEFKCTNGTCRRPQENIILFIMLVHPYLIQAAATCPVLKQKL